MRILLKLFYRFQYEMNMLKYSKIQRAALEADFERIDREMELYDV